MDYEALSNEYVLHGVKRQKSGMPGLRTGTLWIVAGILYLAVQTSGFRRNLNV